MLLNITFCGMKFLVSLQPKLISWRTGPNKGSFFDKKDDRWRAIGSLICKISAQLLQYSNVSLLHAHLRCELSRIKNYNYHKLVKFQVFYLPLFFLVDFLTLLSWLPLSTMISWLSLMGCELEVESVAKVYVLEVEMLDKISLCFNVLCLFKPTRDMQTFSHWSHLLSAESLCELMFDFDVLLHLWRVNPDWLLKTEKHVSHFNMCLEVPGTCTVFDNLLLDSKEVSATEASLSETLSLFTGFLTIFLLVELLGVDMDFILLDSDSLRRRDDILRLMVALVILWFLEITGAGILKLSGR